MRIADAHRCRGHEVDGAASGAERLADDVERGPGQLLGANVVINDYMAGIGASNVPVLFGDWKAGYVVRTAGVVSTVLHERFSDSLQNALLCFERVDGSPLDVDALTALACHS
jgi:HK97 family phage major capsid protein